jgi:hypothetical protein
MKTSFVFSRSIVPEGKPKELAPLPLRVVFLVGQGDLRSAELPPLDGGSPWNPAQEGGVYVKERVTKRLSGILVLPLS